MTEHNERELLEWAAKAAGIDARRLPYAWPDRFDDDLWDSTIDDADCACLESAVGIDIEWHTPGIVAIKRRPLPHQDIRVRVLFSDHGGDKNKARRWASTLAAATLGKSAAMDGEKPCTK